MKVILVYFVHENICCDVHQRLFVQFKLEVPNLRDGIYVVLKDVPTYLNSRRIHADTELVRSFGSVLGNLWVALEVVWVAIRSGSVRSENLLSTVIHLVRLIDVLSS